MDVDGAQVVGGVTSSGGEAGAAGEEDGGFFAAAGGFSAGALETARAGLLTGVGFGTVGHGEAGGFLRATAGG